jgi:hypothetical protein
MGLESDFRGNYKEHDIVICGGSTQIAEIGGVYKYRLCLIFSLDDPISHTFVQ